jgi:hypothetical protein
MNYIERYVVPTGFSGNGGTSESDAWDIATAFTNLAAGMRLNIKQGIYSNLTTIGVFAGGAYNNLVSIRGYKNIPGDGFQGRNPNGTLNTGNMPTLIYQLNNEYEGNLFTYCISDSLIIYTSGVGIIPFLANKAGNWYYNCHLENTAQSTGTMLGMNTACGLVHCDLNYPRAASGAPVVRLTQNGKIENCRISGKYGSGVAVIFDGANNTNLRGAYIGNSVIFDHRDGIACRFAGGTPVVVISNNTITRCSGSAISMTPSLLTYHPVVFNNYVSDCTYFMQSNTANAWASTFGNRFFTRLGNQNMITDDYASNSGWNYGSGGHYVDGANNNFNLTNVSLGRRASVIKNRDIGAMQSYDSFGAAGG